MMLDRKLSVIEIHVPECGDVCCVVMELVSSQKIEQVTVGLLEDEIFQSIDYEGHKAFLEMLGDFGKLESTRQDSCAL
jgi:hypothetical protein